MKRIKIDEFSFSNDNIGMWNFMPSENEYTKSDIQKILKLFDKLDEIENIIK